MSSKTRRIGWLEGKNAALSDNHKKRRDFLNSQIAAEKNDLTKKRDNRNFNTMQNNEKRRRSEFSANQKRLRIAEAQRRKDAKWKQEQSAKRQAKEDARIAKIDARNDAEYAYKQEQRKKQQFENSVAKEYNDITPQDLDRIRAEGGSLVLDAYKRMKDNGQSALSPDALAEFNKMGKMQIAGAEIRGNDFVYTDAKTGKKTRLSPAKIAAWKRRIREDDNNRAKQQQAQQKQLTDQEKFMMNKGMALADQNTPGAINYGGRYFAPIQKTEPGKIRTFDEPGLRGAVFTALGKEGVDIRQYSEEAIDSKGNKYIALSPEGRKMANQVDYLLREYPDADPDQLAQLIQGRNPFPDKGNQRTVPGEVSIINTANNSSQQINPHAQAAQAEMDAYQAQQEEQPQQAPQQINPHAQAAQAEMDKFQEQQGNPLQKYIDQNPEFDGSTPQKAIQGASIEDVRSFPDGTYFVDNEGKVRLITKKNKKLGGR